MGQKLEWHRQYRKVERNLFFGCVLTEIEEQRSQFVQIVQSLDILVKMVKLGLLLRYSRSQSFFIASFEILQNGPLIKYLTSLIYFGKSADIKLEVRQNLWERQKARYK